MASGSPDLECQFVLDGQSFHGVLLDSRVFFLVFESSWRRGGLCLERFLETFLYLAAKPTHMGVDVDELANPLHRHMACSCQTRGQGLLPSIVLSHHCSGAAAPF
jgi:hypothetical protein